MEEKRGGGFTVTRKPGEGILIGDTLIVFRGPRKPKSQSGRISVYAGLDFKILRLSEEEVETLLGAFRDGEPTRLHRDE